MRFSSKAALRATPLVACCPGLIFCHFRLRYLGLLLFFHDKPRWLRKKSAKQDNRRERPRIAGHHKRTTFHSLRPAHYRGKRGVRGQVHVFSSKELRLTDPGSKSFYDNSYTLGLFLMFTSRGSAAFRVLSARNGVLAREIEPSE